MSDNKRKRTQHFTELEKEFLIKLIAKKYATVLEDKKTNRTSMEVKNNVWLKIEREFNANAVSACYRSAASLQRLYENKKKELRRKKAEEKKAIFLTGGGAPPIFQTSELDEILLSIMCEKSVGGLKSSFDSDAADMSSSMGHNTDEMLEYIVVNEEDNVDEMVEYNIVTDEKKNTYENNHGNVDSECQNNKRKRDSPLSSRRRPQTVVKTLTSSHLAEKYDQLLNRRLDLVKKQVEQIESDQKHQNEVQKLELDVLRLKANDLKLSIALKKTYLKRSSNTDLSEFNYYLDEN